LIWQRREHDMNEGERVSIMHHGLRPHQTEKNNELERRLLPVRWVGVNSR
jgi:hypothetical protein